MQEAQKLFPPLDKKLLSIFLVFATFTVTASIFSKAFLQETPRPLLLTFTQGLVGTIAGFLYFTKGFIKAPPPLGLKILKNYNLIFLVVIFFTHLCGTAFTNIAMYISSAAFVSTLKAADPLFACGMAKVLLGEEMNALTIFSLFVIVGGIILSCETEWDFHFEGMMTEFLANFCFPLRSILIKKLVQEAKLDSQVLFWYLSIWNCFSAFIGLFFENASIEGESMFDISSTALWYLIIAATAHYIYNLFSMIMITRVSALTYSIGNSLKRLAAIYTSIIWFGSPASIFNLLASAIAFGGVALYSYSKRAVGGTKPKTFRQKPIIFV